MGSKRFVVLVREGYMRNLQIYNAHGPLDKSEAPWAAAVMPGYLGIYSVEKMRDAIEIACADHDIVSEAVYTIQI